MAAARILVVDDDPAMLYAVSRMLKRAGYEVLSAERPRHALEIVATSPLVDLVVSDNTMPEMHGTQLVREVAHRSPQTACMLMTGGVIPPVDVPAGVPIIRKPFTRQDLISIVQASLQRSSQARADLRAAIEKSAEQRRLSAQLRAETAETIRQAIDILKRLGSGREKNAGRSPRDRRLM